jgi:hypothetical protein
VIRNAKQLKAKIQQLTKGDSLKSQIYLWTTVQKRILLETKIPFCLQRQEKQQGHQLYSPRNAHA